MNILIGLYQPTEGKIFLNGKEERIESPSQAVKLGIGMELDTTLGKYKGYTEAAQFVNKDVKVLDPVYAGSFSATDKGIEFAKAMLAREKIASGLPAAEACYACGFGDYSAFARAYRKLFSASPRSAK